MLTFIWQLCILTNDLFQRFAPTNRFLWFLRRRENLRYGVPAMLLAVPFLLVARGILALIEVGASEWLYLVFMLCLWNACKFFVFGPISLVLLARARRREAAQRARSAVATDA